MLSDLPAPSRTTQRTIEQNDLLEVRDLGVGITRVGEGVLPIVDGANLTVHRDQSVGIVGESGSGKTMLCRALIGTLRRHGARLTSGKILFAGENLADAPERVWRQVRGRKIGYVPQSSLAGLNPVLTIETQLVESMRARHSMGRREARDKALDLLEMVAIPRARQVLKQRSPHLSGGMRQRVMIATALAQEPKLLIADEPTTALDVTIQREILNLIQELRVQLGMALILVSHDLAVIEEVCDSIMVMYAGASVEAGSVETLALRPRHPYTRGLRAARVDLAIPGEDLAAVPGDPVTVGSWPQGCRFWPRCPLADDECRSGIQPPLEPVDQQLSACIHADRMDGVQ